MRLFDTDDPRDDVDTSGWERGLRPRRGALKPFNRQAMVWDEEEMEKVRVRERASQREREQALALAPVRDDGPEAAL